MEKIRNLSLKKTIILYMAVSLTVCFLISATVTRAAAYGQQRIWWKYIDQEGYLRAMDNEKDGYEASIPRVGNGEMNDTDRMLSEICDFLETYSGLLIPMIGSVIAVHFFYKKKIKAPVKELAFASEMIAKNELDFHISYSNKDELGTLCDEFEKMRSQLAENNRILWRLIEEEKALRSAVAHDIRSPLSVLHGYQEMLLEFVPTEVFDKERMIDMLQESMRQTERIDHFVDTMRQLSCLEERGLQYQKIDLRALKEEIYKNVEMIGQGSELVNDLCLCAENREITVDRELILEVVDNLYSNALRFAKQRIGISISLTGRELAIAVSDDGTGFTEDVDVLTKAYYHSNPKDDLNHFGMGMYISRILCERHGGCLLTGNQEDGGAVVKAIFKGLSD